MHFHSFLTYIPKRGKWCMLRLICCAISPAISSAHLPWYHALSIPEASVSSCCALMLIALRRFRCGGESKAERMDWYSGQTTGLLLEAPFKHNASRPLKPVCSCLLSREPTSEWGCTTTDRPRVKRGYGVWRQSNVCKHLIFSWILVASQ